MRVQERLKCKECGWTAPLGDFGYNLCPVCLKDSTKPTASTLHRVARISFIVTMDYNPNLEANVIKNYISSALNKFHKTFKNIGGSGHSGYFDGYTGVPKCLISFLPMVDRDNLKEVIEQVKLIDEHMMGAQKLEE